MKTIIEFITEKRKTINFNYFDYEIYALSNLLKYFKKEKNNNNISTDEIGLIRDFEKKIEEKGIEDFLMENCNFFNSYCKNFVMRIWK